MIKIIINTVLGLVLIVIWSYFVDIKQILSTISKVNLIYLLPVFLFMFLSPLVRALRLKVFLAGIKKISLRDLIYLNGVAMMLNFFIPIRAGEIAKGIYLNTEYKLDLKKGIIWVFLDRFVDFLAVLLLTGLITAYISTKLPSGFPVYILSISLFAFIITYFVVFQVGFSRKIIHFLKPFLIEKHIKIYFDKFTSFILDTFSILKRSPKDLVLIVILTILAYIVDACIWFIIFISLGFPQDFIKMFLGQLLSALTYLVPAAPGYVGSAEASGLLILSGVFGINANLASAMTVLFHILSAIFVLIFGLISIFNLKIDLGVILNKALKRN